MFSIEVESGLYNSNEPKETMKFKNKLNLVMKRHVRVKYELTFTPIMPFIHSYASVRHLHVRPLRRVSRSQLTTVTS